MVIDVEICYALPEKQFLEKIQVPYECTVIRALMQSGFLDRFPEIDLATASVGIFSDKVSLNHVLNEGDRIEIYRPLTLNPNQLRLQRLRKTQ